MTCKKCQGRGVVEVKVYVETGMKRRWWADLLGEAGDYYSTSEACPACAQHRQSLVEKIHKWCLGWRGQ